MARRYAKKAGLNLIVKTANWKTFGKGAGPKRNLEIVSECDYMIAFPSKYGSGTQNSIELAKKHGIETKIIEIV